MYNWDHMRITGICIIPGQLYLLLLPLRFEFLGLPILDKKSQANPMFLLASVSR